MSSSPASFVRLMLSFVLPAAAVSGQCATQWVTTSGVPGVAVSSSPIGTYEMINGATLWDPDGAGPATPRVVVVGHFNLAGNVLSPKIAAWDPASGTWSAIGPSAISSSSHFSSVLGLPNGHLVVGGYFQAVNGVPASCIARWDGTTWTSLGAGLDNDVKSVVALPNGDLVATGYFAASGATATSGIARWDGTAWSPLGSGLTGPAGTSGRALTVLPNGDVVVGGYFTSAGGVALANIARWNGAAWSPLGSGIPTPTTAQTYGVYGLATAPNGDVVAGGFFTTSLGSPADRIARWNGSSWSAIGGGVSNIVRSVAFAVNGDLFAGGFFTSAGGQPASRIARWSGSAWSPLAAGVTTTTPNSAVYAMVPLPNGDLVAAGQFHAAGSALHVARWNGVAWAPLSGGTDNQIMATATMPNGDLVVAGNFTTIEGTAANRIARRTAAGWVPLGSGCSTAVSALAPLPNGDLVAAGGFVTAGGVTVNGVARWNGTSWSAMGTGLGGGGSANALAVMPNGDVALGGWFATAGGVAVNNIARWDGTSWAPLGSGLVGYVNALAVMPNGDLVVGGGFTQVSGLSANHIARWDGTSWSAFGSGISAPFSPTVLALLALSNGELIVGGRFEDAGGVAANCVARWTGSNWTSLGAGVDPLSGTLYTRDVRALAALPNGDLVVGGYFPSASGVPAPNIARWNGTTWSAFGIGCNNAVATIASLPTGELAIGGPFYAVDNTASAYLAYRVTTCPASAVPSGSGCTGSAGPNTLTAHTLPWLGSTCRAVASGAPTNSLVIAAFGLGTLSQPLAALLPQGVAGCLLLVTPDLLATAVPTAGVATIDLAIPNAAALIGGVLHEQALPLEFDALGLQALTSSNALTLTIGTF